jgi:drug/metabolite transporter (DMT)-like permease
MDKFVAYAAISIAIGVLLRLFGPQVPPEPGIHVMPLILRSSCIWYFLIMGVLYLIGGVLTLCLYIHRTPKRSLEEE